ncbi:histidine phosphatase family protein [Streptomyces sp. NPDC002559]
MPLLGPSCRNRGRRRTEAETRGFAAEAVRHGVPVHRLRTPGGESSEDVQARYVGLWDKVCSGVRRTTLLVGHGGGVACLSLWLTGSGFDRYLQHVPGSAGVTCVEIGGPAPRARPMNVSPADLPVLLNARTAR